MSTIPKLRLRPNERSRYDFTRKIKELPYTALNKSSVRTHLSSRSTNTKLLLDESSPQKSRRCNSPFPDTYLTSYNSELKKALNFIKNPEKSKLHLFNLSSPNKDPKKPHSSMNRPQQDDDDETKQFIEAIFLTEPSVYRKHMITSEKETIDLTTADKLLQEAKKIVKNGIKKKHNKHELSGNIEEFWYQHISKSPAVRWDTFEDSLLSFIRTYMMIDSGVIRKVNWRKFFAKLFIKLAKEDKKYSLWVIAPCYPELIDLLHRLVFLSDFARIVLAEELATVLVGCIDEIPSIPIKKQDDCQFLYACGCKYKGQWSNGLRHGDGLLEMCSKEVYQGTFAYGLLQGFGSLRGPQCLYKGCFSKEKIDGFGKITYPDGSYFEGILEKNKLVSGTVRWSCGMEYVGELRNNQIEGKGVRTTANGEIQEGMWCQGVLHGEGTVRRPGGAAISGIFLNGFLNHKGKLACADYKYSGYFTESVPDGTGKFFFFASNNRYKGEVRKGKIEGTGIMGFGSGERYEGEFLDWKIHGQGVYSFADGRVYEGIFVDGIPQGLGKFTFAEGELREYHGQVQEGVINGHGKGVFRNNAVFEGEWVNGSIAGSGVWVKENIKYEGEVFQRMFHGVGSLWIESAYYTGSWKMGKAHGNGDTRDFTGNSYTGGFMDGLPTGRHKLDEAFLKYLCNFKI